MTQSMQHFSDNKFVRDHPIKASRREGCFKRTCPGTRTAKIEICELLHRLEEAESEMMRATLIIKHLSTMDKFNEKIKAMKPYPHQSEGHEVRQMLWDMEKRIAILHTYFRRQTLKAIYMERVRHSQDQDKKEREMEQAQTSQTAESHDVAPPHEDSPAPKEKAYIIVHPGTDSQDTIVSFRLVPATDFELRPDSPPMLDPATCGYSKIAIRSPTRKILGGNITMREILRDVRGEIAKAREKFGDTRRTLFNLSKLLIHVRDNVPLDTLCNCANEVENMKSALNALTGGQFESDGKVDFVHNRRLRKSERAIRNFDSRIRKIGNFGSRIDRFQRHVKGLDGNLIVLFGRLDAGLPLRSGVNDNPTKIAKLFNTIRVLEQNIKDVSGIPTQLQESEIQRDATVDAIEEYVELLGIIKLDKIDLEDAFDEKVPVEELRSKVHRVELSIKRNTFDAVIDHNKNLFDSREEDRRKVAKNIEDILKSKIHLDQLLDFEKFLNKHFKRVLAEIERAPEVRSLIEAAGTRKMLSEYSLCCRCAAKMRGRTAPRAPRQITPYHAYELRMLEKKQLKLLGIKDPKQLKNNFAEKWETLIKPKKVKKKIIEKRACGGTHTKTTPEQRLIRVVPCEEQPICHRHAVPAENKQIWKFVCDEMKI